VLSHFWFNALLLAVFCYDEPLFLTGISFLIYANFFRNATVASNKSWVACLVNCTWRSLLIHNWWFFCFKVCGTTGKRKACKNCSCGLAEELAAEGKDVVAQPVQTKTSACGNVNWSMMSIMHMCDDIFTCKINIQSFDKKTLGRSFVRSKFWGGKSLSIISEGAMEWEW
jgi:hypothetical protein